MDYGKELFDKAVIAFIAAQIMSDSSGLDVQIARKTAVNRARSMAQTMMDARTREIMEQT